MKNFGISTQLYPGDHLTAQAEVIGVDPQNLMRDYCAIGHVGTGSNQRTLLTVGDMANNIAGDTYEDASFAAYASLPRHHQLNGGHIGSLALRNDLRRQSATGPDLVAIANRHLDSLYRSLDLPPAHEMDPAERFTGYFTRADIGPEKTVITTIGDVYAWVNGNLEAGAEKPIDTAKDQLVHELTQALHLPGDQQLTHFTNIVEAFNEAALLTDALIEELTRSLVGAVEQAPVPDRQTVYKVVDNLVTPAQIRTMQNKYPEVHPMAYGAVDGTDTPACFVAEKQFETTKVDTVVVATDGSRPKNKDGKVYGPDDLEPVNPKYNERIIVYAHRENPKDVSNHRG